MRDAVTIEHLDRITAWLEHWAAKLRRELNESRANEYEQRRPEVHLSERV